MITVKTTDPAGLLKAIYDAIDSKSIATWVYDKDKDFTHKPEQWYLKAWLRPFIPTDFKGELRFHIITSTHHHGESRVVYGVYNGRLIKMLLNYFDTSFTSATATAMATGSDVIGKPAAT